jgi:hypothetical protein
VYIYEINKKIKEMINLVSDTDSAMGEFLRKQIPNKDENPFEG